MVVGSKGGGRGSGRSACMLYHDVGIWSGFNVIKASLFVVLGSPLNISVHLCTLGYNTSARTYLYFIAQKCTFRNL